MCDIHTWELPSSLMFIITTLWSSGKSNVNWAICGAQQCFKILLNHVHISGKEGYSGIFVAGYSHHEHWAVTSLSLLLCSWSLTFFFLWIGDKYLPPYHSWYKSFAYLASVDLSSVSYLVPLSLICFSKWTRSKDILLHPTIVPKSHWILTKSFQKK